MSDAFTTKPKTGPQPKDDLSRFNAMTEQQRHDAALSDPDAQPIRPEDLARMRRLPQVKVIRRAFRLSQEQFAADSRIPLELLKDWEDRRSEPDGLAKAYLKVIAFSPDTVRQALRFKGGPRSEAST